MNVRDICRVVGFYLLLLAAAIAVPLFLSLYQQIWGAKLLGSYTSVDFFLAFLLTLLLAGILIYYGRQNSLGIYRKEGIAAVVIIWLITPALSCLPFLTSGTLDHFWQAYFEMASGYTTTGSTILHPKKYDPVTLQEVPITKIVPGARDTTYVFYGTVAPLRDPRTGAILKEGIEAVDETLLFWRGFTQWLGGGGIVVLFVAILPLLGVSGKLLYQAEVTGPNKGFVAPRIKETAVEIWKIYFFLTAIQILLLMTVNRALSFFEALTISFATISTGGFSIRNDNLAAYQNGGVEWVVMIFMILGSINFSLYSYALKGKFYRFFAAEFMLFLTLMFLLSSANAYFLWGSEEIALNGAQQGLFSFGEAIRSGFFHLISSMTSTGFFTTQYDIWPYSSQALMWVAMFFGGMSGSTAGGIKIMRIYVLFKLAQYKVESLFKPENVRIFRIENWEVDNNVAMTVLCFFLIVASLSVLGTLIFIFEGMDMETSVSLVACMINNTGVSFRAAGPTESCAFMSTFSLIISALLMILGRLEFYAMLAFFVPSFWRKE